LQEWHRLPSETDGLDNKEKAFLYAAMQLKIEAEKKEMQKIKSKGGKR